MDSFGRIVFYLRKIYRLKVNMQYILHKVCKNDSMLR